MLFRSLENEVGVVLRSFSEIVPAVARMIEPANLARFTANAGGLKNQAVFEIPGMLEQILQSNARVAETAEIAKG